MLNACKGKIRIQVVERGGEGSGGDFAQNFSIQHCTENIYTQFTSTSFMHSLYSFLPLLIYHFLYLLLFTASLHPYISFSLSSPLYSFLTSLHIIFIIISSLQYLYFLTNHFLYLLLVTISLLPYISFSLSSPLYSFLTSLHIIFIIISSLQFL